MHSLPSRKKSGNPRKRERRERKTERKRVYFVCRRYTQRYLLRRQARVPVKKTSCFSRVSFTNTVKSLLREGVRYPSWPARRPTSRRKRERGKNTSGRRSRSERGTIVKSYNRIHAAHGFPTLFELHRRIKTDSCHERFF